MELSIWHFLIVWPLVFMGGFVDSIAGGGGLISLPSYLIAGLPVHTAIGTNKLSSGMGTMLSTYRFSKKGYIPWKEAIFCVICALIGSFCGAHLALLISDSVFKKIMLVILPLTGVYVMRTKTLDEPKPPYGPVKTTLLSMGAALVIGMYDGFYGPGTGTFLILLLTSVAHFPIHTANGVSKSINLTTNITSLVVYLLNGKVYILLGFTAGFFSIAGNFLGTTLLDKVGPKAIRFMMIVVLSIFFVKVCLEIFG